MAYGDETGTTLAARLRAGGGGIGGGGGVELVALWMLSDRDRLQEGALILPVCASSGCTRKRARMLVEK